MGSITAAQGFFRPHGDTIAAGSCEELLTRLAEVDDSVPRRTGGRAAADRERRSIKLYLGALARADRLAYPVEITKVPHEEEPPDFVLITGDRTVAVEVTDAGSQGRQRALTALERAPRGTALEGESTIVPSGEKLRGRGWAGDEGERRWAELVTERVEGKSADLPRYKRFDRRELLIYDNAGLLVGGDLEVAGRHLADRLAERRAAAGERPEFDAVSVIKEGRFLYDVLGAHLWI